MKKAYRFGKNNYVYTWTSDPKNFEEPKESLKSVIHKKNMIRFLKNRVELSKLQIKMDKAHLELLNDE